MKIIFYKWIKRILLGALALVLFASSIGMLSEFYLRKMINEKYPPPGVLIEVDDHQLHYVRGGGPGPITVIFESGLDQGGHLVWGKVQEKVNEFAPTLSYDRAGVLWSERGGNPKTGSAIAEELHELLTKSNVSQPYLLVGHSIAGLTLRSYVDKYPEEVAGVVFVDASHPNQKEVIPELDGGATPPLWVFRFLFSTGIARLMLDRHYPGTDPVDQINVIVNDVFPGHWIGLADEVKATDMLYKEAQEISSFGNIPMAVITGTRPDRWDAAPERIPKEKLTKGVIELQKDLLNLSGNSFWVPAEKSGHYVQLEQPEVIVEAIRELLKRQANGP